MLTAVIPSGLPTRSNSREASSPRVRGQRTPCVECKADGAAAHTLPFSFSLTLQNTGSVARDHLASERTFLAYVRTSLAFASAGVALVQLLRVSASADPRSEAGTPAVARYARPLGATLIAFGMAVLALGTFRYFAIQRALPQGLFPAARVSVLVQAVSLAVLVGVVFGVLVAVHAS
ncbi:hypothetical protein BC834DRAFT_828832 [Gloeopeniophorella convolvens]|nr:hypothetical protein BC834DRAFT_828832 [Gloeopeniophorella convolvens]